MRTMKHRLVGVLAAGLLGLAVVGGAGVVAVAQTPKTAPDKASEKKAVNLDDLPAVAMEDDDTPEAKATKKYLLASKERCRLLLIRLEARLNAGTDYAQLIDGLRELTAAAEELYPDASGQLPWFEFRVAAVKGALVTNSSRDKEDAEGPELVSQLEAEQAKAELALLKLKKKLKK